MTNPISDFEAQKLLRNADLKAKAIDTLAGPFIPKWAEYLSLFLTIAALSYFAGFGRHLDSRFKDFLLGALIGIIVGMAFCLWGVMRQLDAVVVLRTMEAREPGRFDISHDIRLNKNLSDRRFTRRISL